MLNRKTLSALFALWALTFLASSVLAAAATPPSPDDVGAGIVYTLHALHTSSILGISIGILQLGIWAMKQGEAASTWVKKYGKIVVTLSSGVLAVLTTMIAGLPLKDAIIVFLGTSFTAIINDLLSEIGVLKHKNDTIAPAA